RVVNSMMQTLFAVMIIGLVGYLIYKKFNAVPVLLVAGLVMLFASVGFGNEILNEESTTGIAWLDPFKLLEMTFVKNLGNIGLTIMILFGFSSYMNLIGANDVTVSIMTKPLNRIKSKYVIIPVIFLLGNLLSLVVPSAASLAVLLMATLYPVLTRIGISSLTAGAVIATTATIMPTPLGADNVQASGLLGIDLIDYVMMHAKISIPSILVIAVLHFFWQRYQDKKDGAAANTVMDTSKMTQLKEDLPPKYYAFLPILPLILVVGINGFMKDINIGLVSIVLISLVTAMIVEMIRKRQAAPVLTDLNVFFKGMGNGFSMVVSLIIAAGLFVEGIKSLGVVDLITNAASGVEAAGTILMLAFSGTAALLGFISGSGLAVFYASIELIPDIANGVGVNGEMIALPMQMIANLIRSVSPVAAVIIVVCSIVGTDPIKLVKRTSVPIIGGIISVLVLSSILL
ncbi:MAG: C4-dicarboxylate transporter DcuC, partial [Bacilli bacterium]